MLQKLKDNLETSSEQFNQIKPIYENVLTFLNSESHPAATTLQKDINSYAEKHSA